MTGGEGVPLRIPRIVGPAPISKEDIAADDWAEQALNERLPRIRAVATAWGASVAAITALFGTGVVINADAQVRAMASFWDVMYGILAGAALMAASAALYFASRGAQFRLKHIPFDFAGRREMRQQLFESAVSDLRASRLSAVIAVLLLISSMAIRWYAPLK